MKKMSWALTALGSSVLAALALAGCAAGTDADLAGEGEPAAAASVVAVDGYRLDLSAVAEAPVVVASFAKLGAGAFADSHVRAALVGTDEAFSPIGLLGTRSRSESASYALEIDPAKGTLLALAKAHDGAGGAASPEVLEKASLVRLATWGIPADEMGKVVTRPLMAQGDARDGSKEAPVAIAYKTFVFRGVGGIPVVGHRAVVTHDPSGAFHKALVSWPALADRGHRMHLGVPVADVPAIVAAELHARGKTQDAATLSWVYEPSRALNGDVVLTLKIAAELAAIEHDEIVEEPEIELVDVAATP